MSNNDSHAKTQAQLSQRITTLYDQLANHNTANVAEQRAEIVRLQGELQGVRNAALPPLPIRKVK